MNFTDFMTFHWHGDHTVNASHIPVKRSDCTGNDEQNVNDSDVERWCEILKRHWGHIHELTVSEDERHLYIEEKLPLVNLADINVEISHDAIEIVGHPCHNYHYEDESHSFHRRLTLPFSIAEKRIDAALVNGAIYISILKKPNLIKMKAVESFT